MKTFTPEEWSSLPKPFRERWWEETNWGKVEPSGELVTESRRLLGKPEGEELSEQERDVLQWLSNEDFSQYGECHSKALDSLIARGFVQIHGPGEHQSFIAKGTSLMYRAVSLTEAGIARAQESRQ